MGMKECIVPVSCVHSFLCLLQIVFFFFALCVSNDIFLPQCDLVLDAAHRKSTEPSTGPRKEDIVESIIFKASDVVVVNFKDVDLNFARKGSVVIFLFFGKDFFSYWNWRFIMRMLKTYGQCTMLTGWVCHTVHLHIRKYKRMSVNSHLCIHTMYYPSQSSLSWCCRGFSVS